MAGRMQKQERQRRLRQLIADNPFITDQGLADRLGVSVQTVRLDRLELGIPDMRTRIKKVARDAYDRVKSISESEVIGELIDLDLGDSALSVMTPTADMALLHSGVVRGHHLFAMANSLAVAVVDAEIALTGSANVRFLRPVRVGDRLVAKARVREISGRRHRIAVTVRVDTEEVFAGEFVVFAVDED
ncbi:MAG: transcription factor FapR [Bacillota bacterium]|nr:transcription factor FapR [Bacillota bacterium]HOB91775.1 transcription factor FapR [Bacillota bacterium]